MNYKILFPLLTLIGILASCKSKYKIQTFSLNRNIQICDSCSQRKVWASGPKKSIILISDSTLNYTRIVGHIGATTKIKYKLSSDTLILNSIDIYGKKVAHNFQDFSSLYLINKDSLTSLQNDEKYYSVAYKKRIYKKPIGFYIVYENKAHKIKSQKSADRILGEIKNIDAERFIELDKDIAKKRYGVNRKYKTLEYK
jgi:hypothetical protein